ncbi:MAG: B12-binding domain-containing radical SAM protein [Candidatus Odinarchaeota archaeon]
MNQKTLSLLISYAGCPSGLVNLYPDNGLANLASCLIKNGHKVRILDFGTVDTMRLMVPRGITKWLKQIYGRENRLWEKIQLFFINKVLIIFRKRFEYKITADILNIIKNEKIDFVGFKLFTGNGFRGFVWMAKKIKRRYPNLKIFAGGPAVDLCGEYIYNEFADCDALVYGEGEETIVMLAEFVQGRCGLEEIPNLIFRKDSEIIITSPKRINNLDNLPTPVYDEDVYLSMKGNQKAKVIVFDESRGCPYRCAFCYHPSKSGTFTRTKTAKRIVDEMEIMIKKHRINSFRFAGSNSPFKLTEEIAEEIIRRDLRVSYLFMARVNFANEEIFHKLKRSGTSAVLFGIESGSQYLLDNINKNYTVDQIKTAIKAAKRAGLFVIGSFIFPLPSENNLTKNETIHLIRELNFDSYFINPPAVQQGSEWSKNPNKYNIEITGTPAEFAKFWMHFDPIDYGFLLYKIDGKDVRQLVKENASFTKILFKEGLFRLAGEAEALLSQKIGMSPEEFSHLIYPMFFARDYMAVSKLLEELNNAS